MKLPFLQSINPGEQLQSAMAAGQAGGQWCSVGLAPKFNVLYGSQRKLEYTNYSTDKYTCICMYIYIYVQSYGVSRGARGVCWIITCWYHWISTTRHSTALTSAARLSTRIQTGPIQREAKP